MQNHPPLESYMIRCPRLGHPISFSFCRHENNGWPCFKTLDCWFEHFTVEGYLRKEIDAETWAKVFEKPLKPKMNTLMDLIKEAQKYAKDVKE